MRSEKDTSRETSVTARGLGAGLIALLAFAARQVDDIARFGGRYADDFARGAMHQADDLGKAAIAGDDLIRVSDELVPTHLSPNSGRIAPVKQTATLADDEAELLRHVSVEAAKTTMRAVATNDGTDE